LLGEDGMKLAQLWWDIARDETRRDPDRLDSPCSALSVRYRVEVSLV
jgi:hypothetical protein